MIDKTIAHYQVLEKLGEGGMGVVYKARDIKLERFVALKFLPTQLSQDEERKQRFKQEAKAASGLDHPSICTVHEINETAEGAIFIAMAYYEGDTLRERIAQGALAPALAVDFALQIASGLARAHEHDILHRDIKPENVIVTRHSEAKIVDFGLAKLVGNSTLTRADETPGTAAYMSPEQMQGKEIGPGSDIFSLGAVLYEMLTGVHPFEGEYLQALMYAILHESPKPFSEHGIQIADGIEAIVLRMLAKNPDERYPDAATLANDLRALKMHLDSGQQGGSLQLQSPGGVSQVNGSSVAAASTGQARPWLKPVLAIGLFVALVAAILFGRTLLSSLDLAGVPDAKHIAVLGFNNIGGDPANQALCDGLVETLTSKLSQLEQFEGSLWVVPSSEIRRGEVTSASQARQLFGANLVISGSVQRYDDLLQLTINLIDAETLRQVASRMVKDPIRSLAFLQDQVVVTLAEMLNVELLPEYQEALSPKALAAPGAYEFYLQGRGTLQRYDKVENINAAISLLERAIAADSAYAPVQAALGEAYLRKFQATKEVAWVALADEYCSRAIRNDRLLPSAHVTLGLLRTETGRYDQAHDAFQKALELAGTNAEAYRGRAKVYMAQGELEAAEETYKKAIAIKPDYWGGYNDLGVFYFRHGRYEEAIPQFEHVVQLTPQNAKGYRNLGAMYFSLNRYDDALENYNKSLAIQPSYALLSNVGTLYFNQGRFEQAAKMYEQALQMEDGDHAVWGYLASAYLEIPASEEKATSATRRAIEVAEKVLDVNPRDPDVLLGLASYYVDLDNQEEALSYLSRAVAIPSKNISVMWQVGYTYEILGQREKALLWIGRALASGYDRNQIENNPKLADLRKDARFTKLTRE